MVQVLRALARTRRARGNRLALDRTGLLADAAACDALLGGERVPGADLEFGKDCLAFRQVTQGLLVLPGPGVRQRDRAVKRSHQGESVLVLHRGGRDLALFGVRHAEIVAGSRRCP